MNKRRVHENDVYSRREEEGGKATAVHSNLGERVASKQAVKSCRRIFFFLFFLPLSCPPIAKSTRQRPRYRSSVP